MPHTFLWSHCQLPTAARNFPLGFGHKLVKAWEECRELPRTDLRQKRSLDPTQTDRALFEGMATGDLWSDAGVVETFLYLISNKNCRVPDEWLSTMKSFRDEMEGWDPQTVSISF